MHLYRAGKIVVITEIHPELSAENNPASLLSLCLCLCVLFFYILSDLYLRIKSITLKTNLIVNVLNIFLVSYRSFLIIDYRIGVTELQL